MNGWTALPLLISQRLILTWELSSPLPPFPGLRELPEQSPQLPFPESHSHCLLSLHCLGQTSASQILEDGSPTMGTDILGRQSHFVLRMHLGCDHLLVLLSGPVPFLLIPQILLGCSCYGPERTAVPKPGQRFPLLPVLAKSKGRALAQAAGTWCIRGVNRCIQMASRIFHVLTVPESLFPQALSRQCIFPCAWEP